MPRCPTGSPIRRPTVNLKDLIKIALAVGLVSVGAQLYAAPSAQAQTPALAQPASR